MQSRLLQHEISAGDIDPNLQPLGVPSMIHNTLSQRSIEQGNVFQGQLQGPGIMFQGQGDIFQVQFQGHQNAAARAQSQQFVPRKRLNEANNEADEDETPSSSNDSVKKSGRKRGPYKPRQKFDEHGNLIPKKRKGKFDEHGNEIPRRQYNEVSPKWYQTPAKKQKSAKAPPPAPSDPAAPNKTSEKWDAQKRQPAKAPTPAPFDVAAHVPRQGSHPTMEVKPFAVSSTTDSQAPRPTVSPPEPNKPAFGISLKGPVMPRTSTPLPFRPKVEAPSTPSSGSESPYRRQEQGLRPFRQTTGPESAFKSYPGPGVFSLGPLNTYGSYQNPGMPSSSSPGTFAPYSIPNLRIRGPPSAFAPYPNPYMQPQLHPDSFPRSRIGPSMLSTNPTTPSGPCPCLDCVSACPPNTPGVCSYSPIPGTYAANKYSGSYAPTSSYAPQYTQVNGPVQCNYFMPANTYTSMALGRPRPQLANPHPSALDHFDGQPSMLEPQLTNQSFPLDPLFVQEHQTPDPRLTDQYFPLDPSFAQEHQTPDPPLPNDLFALDPPAPSEILSYDTSAGPLTPVQITSLFEGLPDFDSSDWDVLGVEFPSLDPNLFPSLNLKEQMPEPTSDTNEWLMSVDDIGMLFDEALGEG